MIRILLADDHAVVCQGLRKILSEGLEAVAFGEAGDGRQTLRAAADGAWDLVIMDLHMPGMEGLDLLVRLRRAKPQVPVLVLSFHPEDGYALRALKAGAAGYLTKETVPERLCDAVRQVLHRGRYISPPLAEKLLGELTGETLRFGHDSLSDREFQVLRLIGSGKTGGEIARTLFLSPKTVSTYRTRLLEKLRMRNTAELIRYALDHRLVD
ncbi:MAG: response regulator transcription factor [Pseudomonadota bacterium]|nr:response regulator transcription factor [Pseudomonadota bacterium]